MSKRKIDCAAFNPVTGKCKGLNVPACIGKTCRFKQTEKENLDSRRRAQERILSLSFKQQEHIAAKYYNGAHPWNG